MKEKLKIVIFIILIIAVCLLGGVIVYNGVKAKNETVQNPVATFTIKEQGNIKVELYPEYAPNTVSNFIALIESGFYNDKIIYGKDDVCLYMARNSDENAEGPKLSLIDDSIEAGSDGDYQYEINGEFIANKFEKNTLRHEKGVLSLNRSDYTSYGLKEESYNSGSYRFSVIMNDASELNGVYCAFGKVVEGLDILENIYNNTQIKIAEDEENTTENDIKEFETAPVIENASVEKFGVEYSKPEVHEAFDIQSYFNKLYSSYM